MTLELGIALVLGPLVLSGAVAFAIRETPVRSRGREDFAEPPTPLWVPIAVVVVAAALYLAGSQSRAETFFLVLVVASVAGAGFVERELLATVAGITYGYVNPRDWTSGAERPGPNWRYEMQARYVRDPEYVDRIALDMLLRHQTYEDFTRALARDEFPEEYADKLDKRLWGPAFPTVRGIIKEVIVEQVLRNEGRFTAGRTAEDVFDELRGLAGSATLDELDGPERRRLLDRWQYYWTLRNINFIDGLMERVRGVRTVLALAAAGGALFLVGLLTIAGEEWSAELVLRAVAGGALTWLVVVCAGASLLIVGVFRGTGTFSIARPTRGIEFDPLWNQVIQVGILAFAVSFLVYGIGAPFLLEPSKLTDFSVDGEFLAYSGGTFLFCMFVFVVHTVGVHNLMRASKDNALDRASEDLRRDSADDATIDHFKDVRHMRVWPLRASTVFQLLGGILVPIAVQGFLLYVGLER